MKKLFILAIVTLIGGATFAQTSTTTRGLRYGLKAGVNLPKYNFSDDDDNSTETDNTTNFHVTGYVDAPIGSILSVQPGISLQGKGGKFFDSNNIQSEQNVLWAEVPVNLVAHIPLTGSANIFLGAGPYAAFAISGQNKTTIASTTTKADLDFGDDNGDDLKGTDFGVNFMGGFQFGNGVNIGAGYGLGLSDLRPGENSTDGKATNRVWSFSLGFDF